jgi:eukaryotic-like serine/threonine-protein kinase
MAAFWSCSRGHQWERCPDDPPGQSLICPVCGLGEEYPPLPRSLPTLRLPNGDDAERTSAPPQPGESTEPGGRTPPPPSHAKATSNADSAEKKGRFTILRRHAKGGLGKVSIARDEDLQREVALKEILPESADDRYNRDRFVNEAMVTGRLEHPGIVPVYALGHDEQGRPYYAMKLLRGKTLHDAIRDYHALSTPLEFRGLLRHFVDVCQAIAFAHSQGVIHRDLKPANVMLGDYGETLVLDWGLAKCVKPDAPTPERSASEKKDTPSVLAGLPDRPELTLDGQVMGTPAYMSPEQAGGEAEQIGPATDVYSLGCVLFELLSGRPPFDELSTMDLLDRKRTEAPPLPSRIKPGVPRALEAICVKAIAREPKDRYTTAVALAQDIERWLADESVSAYREPPWSRLARWGRRHRPFVVGALILFLLAFVALAITNEVIRREKQEKERANLDARIQRDRAMARFQLASETLDVMLKRMGHNRQALVMQMDVRSDPWQLATLRDVQNFYERFLKEQSREPALRRELAMAHHRIGDILKMKGEHLEAERAYERAIHHLDYLPANSEEAALLLGERAECQHDLGLLLYVSSRFGEAERQYLAALECHRRLWGHYLSYGRSIPARLAEARVHHQYALLLRDTGRLESAEKHFESASLIRQELGENSRTNPGIRRAIAITDIDFSDLLMRMDRFEEAEQRSRDAAESLRQLITEVGAEGSLSPDYAEYRHELAGSLHNLGLVLAAKKPSEAEAAYREALVLRVQLVAQFSSRPDFRYELALCRLNLGVLYYGLKRPEAAEKEWQLSREEFVRLATDFQQAPVYTSKLAQVQNNLAALRADRGDLPAARDLLTSAVQLQRRAWEANKDHPSHRGQLCDHLAGLADVLVRMGLPSEAAAAAGELPLISPEGPQEWRRAAGLLARCASAAQAATGTSLEKRDQAVAELALKAIALLRSAKERGYADVAELKQAKEFDVLRTHPDFVKLLEEFKLAPTNKPPE